MLTKTGVPKGHALGEPKEKKLGRSLLRQYQAADAIAYNGYKIENNPTLSSEDIESGIRPNAEPDFRIEGFIFDCYTPDPPSRAEEHAWYEAFNEFALSDPVCGESAPYDEDWIDEVGGWEYLEQKAKQRIIDVICNNIQSKVHEKQSFNIVINLVDVRKYILQDDLSHLMHILNRRRIRGLGHLLILISKPGDAPDRLDVIELQRG